MQYVCDLGTGQQLTLRNQGSLTYIGFHSTGPGQQQSQRSGIDTGPWTGRPAVLRLKNDLLLRLECAKGTSLFHIGGNRITPMGSPPDLENARELPIRESDDASDFRPMEPMQPMRPMEPMKPMEPMQPMQMSMGNMSMKMGEESGSGSVRARKFCTQCGNALAPEDRYCGSCGHKA